MAGKPLPAGKLRHRVTIERPQLIQNEVTGDVVPVWYKLADVWAAIEPLSAREFIASQAENSEIIARITIRYRDDIDPSMRIVNGKTGKIYNIQGCLPDAESGLKYLTLPVSQGITIYSPRETFNVVHLGNNVKNSGNQVIQAL